MLSLTNLEGASDPVAGRLSGGIGRVSPSGGRSCRKPALLLLDEPAVESIPVSRQELWDIIAQATAGGTALIFTSAYLEDSPHASRLLAMERRRWSDPSSDRVIAACRDWSACGKCGSRRADRVRTGSRRWRIEPRVYLRRRPARGARHKQARRASCSPQL